MEHPYRVHSSIGFGFLHLLFMSSLAYPTPIPPVYHNTAVLRMMGTIYFTIFQDKPFYLKLECATILIEMICDVLYIRYIILDYTYVFGVIDVISNALICVFILLSIQNGDANTKEIIDKIWTSPDKINLSRKVWSFGAHPEFTDDEKRQIYDTYPYLRENYDFAVSRFGKEFINSIWWNPYK